MILLTAIKGYLILTVLPYIASGNALLVFVAKRIALYPLCGGRVEIWALTNSTAVGGVCLDVGDYAHLTDF